MKINAIVLRELVTELEDLDTEKSSQALTTAMRKLKPRFEAATQEHESAAQLLGFLQTGIYGSALETAYEILLDATIDTPKPGI